MEPIIPIEMVRTLRSAEHIAVLTGAGISAESGIPTFRDALTGLWANYDPQELATPTAFRSNPRLVWEWYAWRRTLIADKHPNPAHHALVTMARQTPRLTLITQNVDGLHQEAGSEDVIELHGNIRRFKCFDRHHPVTAWESTENLPPRCPRCGSFIRPDVVWFGENLPTAASNAAVLAAQNCQVFFSIGTSAIVYPAALLPQLALERGALFIEINPNTTPLSRFADYTFAAPAGKILPDLVAHVWSLD